MIKRLAGIAACAVLLQAGAALAENRAETVTFAPYVGGYTFQGKQHLETSPVYGFRLGYNLTENWALEGVIDYLKTEGTRTGNNVEMVRYGGDLLYNFMPKGSFVPYLAAGFGGFDFNDSKTKAIYNYGGGVKWFMTDDFALRADVRGLNYSASSEIYTNVEYTLGLHIAVGAPKPAPKPVVVEEAVAPKAAPVVAPPADSDGDGVIDELDKCPGTPAGVKVGVGGCPLDSDMDGVFDYQDKCPGTPAAVRVDAEGCPLDSDMDGVPDYLDKCPTTPRGDKVDRNGCTPQVVESTAQKAVAAGTRLSLKVQFDTGKSVIKKQYYGELKTVGDALNEQKELKGIIEGYTDNVGSDKLNQRLSQRRANAVRDYIVKNFKVDGKRLTAKGYGEASPIADNATAEGRAQNRRIEATFEEIPNFKPDAEQQPAPAKKVVKKVAKKKATAKK
ncbi:MAG: outer membrane beta-barrel domain-containing protein [Trichlorobacter sp.]|jgi:OOP family OmpA-OmpF porin